MHIEELYNCIHFVHASSSSVLLLLLLLCCARKFSLFAHTFFHVAKACASYTPSLLNTVYPTHCHPHNNSFWWNRAMRSFNGFWGKSDFSSVMTRWNVESLTALFLAWQCPNSVACLKYQYVLRSKYVDSFFPVAVACVRLCRECLVFVYFS